MDVRRQLFRADPVAGAGAIGAFVVLLILDQPVAAVAVGIAVYAGVVLMRSRTAAEREDTAENTPERSELAYETSVTKVAAIRDLAARVPKEGTRELVVRICDTSDRALATMRSAGATQLAPLFLEQLLEPTEALLESYVRFSARDMKAAAELLARNEAQDLPMIERAARLFAEQIERGETDPKSLGRTLDFALETSTPVTPRR